MAVTVNTPKVVKEYADATVISVDDGGNLLVRSGTGTGTYKTVALFSTGNWLNAEVTNR